MCGVRKKNWKLNKRISKKKSLNIDAVELYEEMLVSLVVRHWHVMWISKKRAAEINF